MTKRRYNIITLVFALFFLMSVGTGESIEYEIIHAPTKKGVTITTAQPGKCYFRVYLNEGEKVWIQILGHMSSDLAMEINHFEYEGTGAVHGWEVPASHKIRRFGIKLWKEKYKYGEGPDPHNEEADKLLMEHYFTGLVDSDSESVR